MTLPARRTTPLLERADAIAADALQLHDEIREQALDQAIIAASTIEDEVRALLGQLVAAFRDQGASWEQVAAPLGVTKQSAWERFRTVDPPVPAE